MKLTDNKHSRNGNVKHISNTCVGLFVVVKRPFESSKYTSKGVKGRLYGGKTIYFHTKFFIKLF